MVRAKVISYEQGLDEVNEILYEVFVEEMNINKDIIFNIKDNQVFHVLVYEGVKEDKPIATGRLVLDNNIGYIKWIAVKKEYRRKQYGDFAIRMLVEKARALSCIEIKAEVPIKLIDMFSKIGFNPLDDKTDIDSNAVSDSCIIMRYNDNYIKPCQIKAKKDE